MVCKYQTILPNNQAILKAMFKGWKLCPASFVTLFEYYSFYFCFGVFVFYPEIGAIFLCFLPELFKFT